MKILANVPLKFLLAAANVSVGRQDTEIDPNSYWELGKTKIFMKYFVISALMASLDRYHYRAIVLQRYTRGFLAKKYVSRVREQRKREAEEAALAAARAKEQAIREKAEKVYI